MGRVLRRARTHVELVTAGRIHLLPIIHGSAFCASRVARAIEALAPEVVCVELPCDAAPLVPHLRAAPKLPVAIFGFAAEGRAVLPLADGSPEVVALRADARIACIDVPLEHAVADRDASGLEAVGIVAARLGCRSAGELVDRLLADDATALQLLALVGSRADPTPRERAMAHAIRREAEGTTLVVVGAAHVRAIHGLLAKPGRKPAFASTWQLYVVPYDEPRLHQALPFPRWRRLGGNRVAELAVAIGRAARRARLLSSVGDEVELVHAARQLAHLRRLREPGLAELLDAASLALVRDRAGEGGERDLSSGGAFGPLGPILERVLVGTRVGAVPPEAPRVPIVADVVDALAAARLANEARLELDVVRSKLDRTRSALLHRLRYVESPAVELRAGPDLVEERDVHRLFEHWSLAWDADAEAQLLELAPRGATLAEVVVAMLHERVTDVETASRELVAALTMDLADVASTLLAPIERLAARETDLVRLWRAASRLRLARVSMPSIGIAAVEASLVERALAALAATSGDPPEGELVGWLDALHGLIVHGEHHAALAAAARAIGRTPLLLGAATAVLFGLHELPEPELIARVQMQCAIGVAEPAALCRFLLGLLLPARSLLVRVPALLVAIGRVLADWSEDAFAEALPELRFAFAALSPRELRRISEELAPVPLVPHMLREGFAAELDAELARLGLSGPDPSIGASSTLLEQGTRSSSLLEHRADPSIGASSMVVERGLDASTHAPDPSMGASSMVVERGPDSSMRLGHGLDPLSDLALARWRLVLGTHGDALPPPTARARRQDELLQFLYGGGPHEPGASLAWLRDIRAAFPARAVETLERHAIERYRLYEMLRDPAVLREMTPSAELVTGLLSVHRDVPPAVLAEIRRIIRDVAERLRRVLEDDVRPTLAATLRSADAAPLRLARNLDLGRTLRRNLHRIDPATGALGAVSELVFRSRVRRHNPWTLVLLVDQSGSMADALVPSAVLAGIFAAIPTLATRLVVFDTEPHDLTDKIADPVEVLLSTELGGGTLIAGALAFAARAITEPARTIVVLISDLGEGGPIDDLVAEVARLKEAGTQLLVLTALDPRGATSVDPVVRRAMRELDVPVAALSPRELAAWVAQQMRRARS